MNCTSNSANTICNYCGAIYNSAYGNHVCDRGELEILIHQEQTMTDDPDEYRITELKRRIQEVKDFWSKYPDHQSSVSKRIPV